MRSYYLSLLNSRAKKSLDLQWRNNRFKNLKETSSFKRRVDGLSLRFGHFKGPVVKGIWFTGLVSDYILRVRLH